MALPKKKISLIRRKKKENANINSIIIFNLVSCKEPSKRCFYPLKKKGLYCSECMKII